LDKKLPQRFKTWQLADRWSNPNEDLSLFQRVRGAGYQAMENPLHRSTIGRAIWRKSRGDPKAFKQEILSTLNRKVLGRMGMVGQAVSAHIMKDMGMLDDNPDFIDEVNGIVRHKPSGQKPEVPDVIETPVETAKNLDARFKLVHSSFTEIGKGLKRYDDVITKLEKNENEHVSDLAEKVMKQVEVNQPDMSRIDDMVGKIDSIESQTNENKSNVIHLQKEVSFLKQRLKFGIHGKGAANDNVENPLDETAREKNTSSKLMKFLKGRVGSVGALGARALMSAIAANPVVAGIIAGTLGLGTAAAVMSSSGGGSSGGDSSGRGSSGRDSSGGGESKTSSGRTNQSFKTSGKLMKIRKQQAEYLKNNPAARKALLVRAQIETGGQKPETQQMWIESALNRAAAEGIDVMSAVDNNEKHRYYPRKDNARFASMMNGSVSGLETKFGSVIDNEILGKASNISDYATDNAYNDRTRLASRKFEEDKRGGYPGRWSDGEYFGADKGTRLNWRKAMLAAPQIDSTQGETQTIAPP